MLKVNPLRSESRALLHALLFSIPFNTFKARAIACVTFVKRMRHTSALNASESALVWTQQLNVVKWIHLTQNRDKQHIPPTIIMKLEVLQNVGNMNEPFHKKSAA